MNIKEKLFSNLSKYVKVNTMSNPDNASVTPSSDGQKVLAKLLALELKNLGLKNIVVTKHSYVLAELPANTKKKMPSVGLIAHMDTSPDFSAENVKPLVHKNYKGGKIVVNAKKGIIIDPAKDKLLNLCKGHDIVTADGNTLLGADDKAGIAIITALLEYVKNNRDFKHGPVKIAFTPDEEIGHGCELMPLDKFKADFAFTIDGMVDDIDWGNFNADGVKITITGVATHPGSAKGVMVNPVLVASDLIVSWPAKHRAEHTEKEKGFIHFTDVITHEDKIIVKAIAREHDLKKLAALEKELKALVLKIEKKHKGSKIVLEFKEQYRNMKDVLKKNPAAMNLLQKALKETGMKYRLEQVRGGTDGARLSFRGLPTPNIMAGYSSPHGPYEWVSLDVMENVLNVCLNIVKER